ncbi:hypothetical protein RclHR1_01070012 [Rhizophagus clarus]|uniref:Uncharacterized protein n=1 Tax=Rhizophagus clarus TaxID=94130 RepID=A0A2Z6Q6U0_9GLOM|nr:hypothetical protein RclHR1_01070012 [Rhizophagus clarus]GET04826.1 hypothetical protein RCL_jg4769.t1 [Rhizophagus clarus]
MEQESLTYDTDTSSDENINIPVIEECTLTFNGRRILFTLMAAVDSNVIDMRILGAGEYSIEFLGVLIIINILDR